MSSNTIVPSQPSLRCTTEWASRAPAAAYVGYGTPPTFLCCLIDYSARRILARTPKQLVTHPYRNLPAGATRAEWCMRLADVMTTTSAGAVLAVLKELLPPVNVTFALDS
jgi:hypothetical protein